MVGPTCHSPALPWFGGPARPLLRGVRTSTQVTVQVAVRTPPVRTAQNGSESSRSEPT